MDKHLQWSKHLQKLKAKRRIKRQMGKKTKQAQWRAKKKK